MKRNHNAMLSRRTLLKVGLSAIFPIADSTSATFAQTKTRGNLYISGARQSTDQYVAVVFDEQAQLRATVPIMARAHGAAAHAQSHRACLFGRRPGYFMNTFDIRSPQHQRVISPIDGRHYYGHGAYSENGNLLYATENDFDKGRGVIGIYDAARDYQRVGELDTYGIGPHELVRVPGSSLLVVANGGIQTHPDTGCEKLNIATMQPSLSIVDSSNGQLVGRHVLAGELHQVSIRHLACSADGELWYAGQYEGDKPSVDGLAGRVSIRQSLQSFRGGESRRGLTLVDLPESVQSRASQYLSSVAIVGKHAVFTSAKGGLVFKLNRVSLQIDESLSILDCSGVTPISSSEASGSDRIASLESALLTCGTGEILSLSDEGLTSLAIHKIQWDNHVYRV